MYLTPIHVIKSTRNEQETPNSSIVYLKFVLYHKDQISTNQYYLEIIGLKNF